MSDERADRIDCRRCAEHLPALLYDEIEGRLRSLVETHLSACPTCRAEHEAHQHTLGLLEAWPAPDAPADAVALAERAALAAPLQLGRRSRLWQPVAVGVAASVAVFLGLALLGASVEYGQGRLTVSLVWPGAQTEPASEAVTPAQLAAWLRELTLDDLDRERDAVLASVDAALADWERRQERQRRLLAYATDLRRTDDRHEQEEALRSLGRQVFSESLRMRERLEHVVTLVSGPDAGLISEP